MKGNKHLSLSAVLCCMLVAIPASAAPGPASENRGFFALDASQINAFSPPSDVKQVGVHNLGAGRSSERFQQTIKGAEVLGGQLSLIRDTSGRVTAVIGSHYPGLLSTNTVKLKPAQAQAIAAAKIGGAGAWKTKLMIHPDTGRQFYMVENRRDDSRWFHWVDAEDGNIINRYDGLTTGSGIGVDGVVKDNLDTTGTLQDGYMLTSADGRQTTYDAGNRNRLPGAVLIDSDDIWDDAGNKSPSHPALVDAHFFANVTDDYYQTTHMFDWTEYYSQGMVSSAHVQRRYNNAYWNGSQMAYGDGDGNNFVELSGDLDVVGHELSHGVTEATSNLIYQNESGALNEAFSDIMGTAIEYYYGTGNWTIGEDITVGSNGIRNMADPGEDGDPSHYADRYTGTGDNGGVHINSGIANHWFYLLVNGGQNSDPAYASGTNVGGIGLAAAEQVAYLGFTALNATADFCAARASTIAISAGDAANVADAWDEVGVDDALCTVSGGGGGVGPVISSVASQVINARRGNFRITWTTDVSADSEVTFACCGTYTSSSLVTGHSMSFNGAKGATYEYWVSSTDANGNKTTDGPHTHNN